MPTLKRTSEESGENVASKKLTDNELRDQELARFFGTRIPWFLKDDGEMPTKIEDVIDQLFPTHDIAPDRETDIRIVCFLLGAQWFGYQYLKGQSEICRWKGST